MAFGKWIIQLLLPYIIDAAKAAYRAFTLKRMREARVKKKAEAAKKYEEAKTDEEIKGTFEDLP
jgi:hypothetical protein